KSANAHAGDSSSMQPSSDQRRNRAATTEPRHPDRLRVHTPMPDVAQDRNLNLTRHRRKTFVDPPSIATHKVGADVVTPVVYLLCSREDDDNRPPVSDKKPQAIPHASEVVVTTLHGQRFDTSRPVRKAAQPCQMARPRETRGSWVNPRHQYSPCSP